MSVLLPAANLLTQTPLNKPAALPDFDPSKLAEIHLPDAIQFWPMATGWWLLLALLVMSILLLVFLRNRNRYSPARDKMSLNKAAQMELQLIDHNYQQHHDALETLKQLSIFLRRYVLSLEDRENVASLTEQQWLEYLDTLYHENFPAEHLFSERFATLLQEGPYRKTLYIENTALVEQLIAELQQLVSRNCSSSEKIQETERKPRKPALEATNPEIAAIGVKHV